MCMLSRYIRCVERDLKEKHQLGRENAIATDAKQCESKDSCTQQTVTLYRSALGVTPQQSEALVAMLIAIATELCANKMKNRPITKEVSDKSSH